MYFLGTLLLFANFKYLVVVANVTLVKIVRHVDEFFIGARRVVQFGIVFRAVDIFGLKLYIGIKASNIFVYYLSLTNRTKFETWLTVALLISSRYTLSTLARASLERVYIICFITPI